MQRKAFTDEELLASALAATGKLIEQTRADEASIAGRSDRDRWADGQARLAQVRQAVETLAKQIHSSSTPDHT